jgi:hypothetical protein
MWSQNPNSSRSLEKLLRKSAICLIGGLLSLLVLTGTAILAAEGPDPCSQAEAQLQAKIASIEAQYKTKIDKKKGEYQQAADQIRHDADASQPTGFGAVTKFDVNVDWKDTSIVFDLPVVMLNQTTLIMGLPEVIINQQKWVYDVPATRMVDRKVFQHPEVTCSPFPNCTVEWKDNIMGVPEFYMERHETVLGVPEFAIRDQKLIFGVPAVTMQRQEIIMGLPWITVKNVDAEVAVVQDEASAFQQKAETDTSRLSAAMKAEIRQAASKDLHRVFQCQKSRLDANRATVLARIDAELSKATTVAQTARANHADAVANTADAVVKQIVATRAVVHAQFDEAARKLAEAEQKALNSF